MLSTMLARLGHAARIKARSAIALAVLAAAVSAVLPVSTAQACGITRRIHNQTNQNLYVEIWINHSREWVASDPIKPGATLSLDYLRLGHSLLITGPRPAAAWGDNTFGVILDIHRCNILRVRGESKLQGYDIKVSVPKNADITIVNRRQAERPTGRRARRR